jgi:hypothetical protein
MATTLGTVTLDRNMVLSDEFTYAPVSSSGFDTLGGGRIIQQFAKSESGRVLTLRTENEMGFQKKSTVTALKSLQSVPEAIYTLNIDGTFIKSVRIQSIDFQMADALNGTVTSNYRYSGEIVMEVA